MGVVGSEGVPVVVAGAAAISAVKRNVATMWSSPREKEPARSGAHLGAQPSRDAISAGLQVAHLDDAFCEVGDRLTTSWTSASRLGWRIGMTPQQRLQRR